MKKIFYILVIPAVLILAGCAGSKTSILYSKKPSHPIKVIAFASTSLGENAKILTDAFKNELSKHGFDVTHNDELAFATPQEILELKQDGIDAYVNAKGSWVWGTTLNSITVNATSAHTGKKITKINWRNSWGGAPGSPMDNSMRKETKVAVKEVVKTLVKYLRID